MILDFLFIFSELTGVSSRSLLTAGVDLITGDFMDILPDGVDGDTDLDDRGDDRGLLAGESNEDLRDNLESLNEDFLDNLESLGEPFVGV